MKLGINKIYRTVGHREILNSEFSITLTFNSKNGRHGDIPIEEFIWFLNVLFDSNLNPDYRIGSSLDNRGSFYSTKRYLNPLSLFSEGTKLKFIRKESPLLISVSFAELSPLISFITLLVSIYGTERTRELIINTVKRMSTHLQNPKSIFIIDEEAEKGDLEVYKESEILDLNDIPQSFIAPNWAEALEEVFKDNNFNERDSE